MQKMLIFCFPEPSGPPPAHREELPRLLPGGDHDMGNDNSDNNEYVDDDDINDDIMTTPPSWMMIRMMWTMTMTTMTMTTIMTMMTNLTSSDDGWPRTTREEGSRLGRLHSQRSQVRSFYSS